MKSNAQGCDPRYVRPIHNGKVAVEPDNEQAEHARSIVENIVRFYREKGFVITVNEDVVSVRPVRK